MVDKKAQKILLDTFWTAGWKKDRYCNADDFEYAKSNGMMFDPVVISHDRLIEQLINIRDRISPKTVGDAFLASLSSRRLDLRSALGSYAFASCLPAHGIISSSRMVAASGSELCRICGRWSKAETVDLNVLNFERHKWGGVRHTDPVYAWFDLSEHQKTDYLEPTEEDRTILKEIIQRAGTVASDATPGTLAKALSDCMRSNESERRILIEILSFCGVLQPSGRSGFFGEFTLPGDRHHTGQHLNDWRYPAIWWRGSDGINATALATYFPDL